MPGDLARLSSTPRPGGPTLCRGGSRGRAARALLRCRLERLLHAALNRSQAALDATACCLRTALSELVDLSLELAVFFDQLSDHRVQLLNQLATAEPPPRSGRRLASGWTTATPATWALLR